jgi:hypothetical protein
MPSQTVMWTAVPDGVEGDSARIVCVVSPRLTDAGRTTIDAWPDWWNWAERAAAVTFAVQFDSRAPVAATRVSPAPELRRWHALIRTGLPVRPFEPARHSEHRIRSYPAANVAGFIKQHYLGTAVASPTEFPLVSSLLDGGIASIGLAFNPKAESERRRWIENALNQVKAVPPVDPAPPLDFLQVVMFHEVDPTLPRVAPRANRFDFHDLVSLLAQYPVLLRRLGLAFDLRVPLSAAAGAGTVSVIPSWTPALPGTTVVRPATRLTVAAGVFRPTPKAGSDLNADALALGTAGFGVLTVDADGAALKVRHFADNLRRSQARPSTDTPTRAALPALRSAGLAAVRTGRAARQVQRFADSAALETALAAGSPVVLDADALLYGLRWSVYDVASGRWYSLSDRRGSYLFLKDRAVDLDAVDAGATTTAVTQRAQVDRPDYYLAEYLCRWEGESLVAPRPGKSLDRDPNGAPSQPDPDPQPDAPLKVRFAPAPGSLPPLRFGRRYRMRATAAYLGGAGPRFDPSDTAVDPARSSAEVTYTRFEPVPPPVVLARRPRVPGESLHHLVIRSDRDTGAAATVPTERHVLPPKTSQLLAEAHGLFDTRSGLDPTAYEAIVARAGGTVDGAGAADPSDPSLSYYDTDRLAFPVEQGTAAVPWIPDPLSRGAALTGLPGVGFGATSVDFGYAEGRTWRTTQPFRIRLVEGSAAPAFDPVGRVLTVSLGKGDVADVALSSQLRQEDLPLLEIWRWLQTEAGLPAATLGTHRRYALDGRHWLLTPAQPLTFAHAVRRPLEPPLFHTTTAVRALGQPVSVLRAPGVGLSRKSTVAVEVTAEWSDPVDTLDGSGWQPRRMMTRRAHLGSVPVQVADATHDEGSADLSVSHDLGDTRTHSVTYYPIAKSRFAEYFTERSTATVRLADDTWFVVDATGVTAGSEVVTAAGTTYERDADYELNGDGQLRRLPNGRIPAGSVVTMSYVPATTLRGNPVTVTVPASARPARPAPLYVLPTFGWASRSGTTGAERTRRGGGLRVYLDRPWWSSGDGEALGVVLWPGATPPDAAAQPYVTAWGRDPLYRAAATPHPVPTVDDFPRAIATRTGLRLDERNLAVSVAAHAVQADTARQLWFCDIELAQGHAHWPFVRLALARYQPNALPGAELSPVVLADFAQLAPDRTASVTYGSDARTVRVGVTGSGYALSADGPSVDSVEVTVERRVAGVPGELGWEPLVEPQALAPMQLSTGDLSWRGTVQLKSARGSEPLRLVVREFEGIGNGRRLTYTDVLPV